ncbi:CdiA family toxin C-terminal domain-containing protein [Aeromonas enteropelogenes]|uniref:CdiA family toxin C-terminal domain-containing protein n=1 Tax=Aeromonas enteropelogenes TaxID=29489 RepID=UPI003B9F0C14
MAQVARQLPVPPAVIKARTPWCGLFFSVRQRLLSDMLVMLCLCQKDGCPSNFDQPKHLATVDGFTQKSGISGGHNANAFYDAAKEYNVKIVSETPTGVNGITEVRYLIPTKDRAGNLTGEYKATPETKTIYDPKIFNDQKMLELGQQAAAKGYKDALNSPNGAANVSVDGISFRIYVDKSTGTVRNYHSN